MTSTPALSQNQLSPSIGISRAATFPVQTPPQGNSAQKLPQGDRRVQVNTISNPNLRQSFHELVSPTDLSASGTPDSNSTVNSMTRPQLTMPQFGNNNTLPDLSAMMFPSADPFAYPNQPMMEIENIKQENLGGIDNPSQVPSMFLSNSSSGSGMYDDLEGQLFGPIPPYLMQGQQPFDVSGQLDPGSNMMPGLHQSDMLYHTGMTPNADMNFDGIFSGDGDDWSNMTDQRFRL